MKLGSSGRPEASPGGGGGGLAITKVSLFLKEIS